MKRDNRVGASAFSFTAASMIVIVSAGIVKIRLAGGLGRLKNILRREKKERDVHVFSALSRAMETIVKCLYCFINLILFKAGRKHESLPKDNIIGLYDRSPSIKRLAKLVMN